MLAVFLDATAGCSRLRRVMLSYEFCLPGERNYSCDVCGRAFRDAYTMRHHHKTVHLGQYRFHCPACGRHFDKLRRLRHHRCTPNTRNETEQVALSTDDVTSTEGSDRLSGNPGGSVPSGDDVTTDTKGEVTCDLCGRVCRDTAALKAHRRVVHHVFITKPTPPKFTCVFCEKDFPSRAKMNAHRLTHSGETRPLFATSAVILFRCLVFLCVCYSHITRGTTSFTRSCFTYLRDLEIII